MNLVATRELARLQGMLHVLRRQKDDLTDLAEMKELRLIADSLDDALREGMARGLVPADPMAEVLSDWRRLVAWSNRVQSALKAADELAAELDSTPNSIFQEPAGADLTPAAGSKQGHENAEFSKNASAKGQARSRLEDCTITLERARHEFAATFDTLRKEMRESDWVGEEPYLELAEVVEGQELKLELTLAERPGNWACDVRPLFCPLMASRRAVARDSEAVQQRLSRLSVRLKRARDLIAEYPHHVAELASITVMIDRGDLDTSTARFEALDQVFSDLDYEAVRRQLEKVRHRVAKQEQAAGDAAKFLLGHSTATTAEGYSIIPPFGRQRRCAEALKYARDILAAVDAEAAKQPGSEAGARLLSADEQLRKTVNEFSQGPLDRVRKVVRVTSTVWLILLLTGVGIGAVCLCRSVREAKRIAAEAKAIADQEEQARRKWEREALAKFGLATPVEAGAAAVIGASDEDKIRVRWIPAGRFQMGSPGSEADRSADETPHEVVLNRGYFIAETECTQGLWSAVMGSNPSVFKGNDRPVETVDWQAASEFCRKLTERHRNSRLLPELWRWNLPTEAQWEYACRAGSTSAYAGDLDAVAWFRGNSGLQTHPVKTKRANPWGLHDMHGNVWEWCRDWYREYPNGSVTDPTGSSSGTDRVIRGGCWDCGAGTCRSASRLWNSSSSAHHYHGFRPVLSFED